MEKSAESIVDDAFEKDKAFVEQQEKNRQIAAAALQQHFSSHPDSVLIVSVRDGHVTSSCTPFADVGVMLLCQKILNANVDESFQKAVLANRHANAMANPEKVQ